MYYLYLIRQRDIRTFKDKFNLLFTFTEKDLGLKEVDQFEYKTELIWTTLSEPKIIMGQLEEFQNKYQCDLLIELVENSYLIPYRAAFVEPQLSGPAPIRGRIDNFKLEANTGVQSYLNFYLINNKKPELKLERELNSRFLEVYKLRTRSNSNLFVYEELLTKRGYKFNSFKEFLTWLKVNESTKGLLKKYYYLYGLDNKEELTFYGSIYKSKMPQQFISLITVKPQLCSYFTLYLQIEEIKYLWEKFKMD